MKYLSYIFLICTLLLFNQGFSQCGPLATPYNQNNGQDGIMFDIVAITSVEITNFDINCGGATHDFEIYYRPGTHVGFENSAVGWTLVGTAFGVNGAVNVATPIPAFFSAVLCAGDVGAFYITSTGAPSIDYTNGVAVGNVIVADANIQILTGTGKDHPFAASFTPRNPNVTAHYNCLALSCCAMQTITAVQGPCNAGVYQTTGNIGFMNPPGVGQLIVEDCDGNQQTFNPPFVSPISYTINGQDPDNGPCDITAYFSSDPACTISQNYTAPAPCSCDPGWTNTTACSTDPPINLDALITGDVGGTWSGTGVTGNTFDPASGTQAVTYTAPGLCDSTLTITITTTGDATWTIPTGLCTAGAPIDLNSQVTGTLGGAWSGVGMTGSVFDPSVGTQSITYSVGIAPCDDILTQTITVVANADASWSPPAGLCIGDAPIDLTTFVTGNPGGTWSGIGITGSMFDPSVGSQNITYSVGIVPCNASSTLMINVAAALNPSWTIPTNLCETGAPINLTPSITGDAGGTWSGTGVAGNMFDPSFGTQSITYTVGSGGCQAISTQTISVDTPPNPSWTVLTICSNSAPVNLTSQITGTPGGVWSGTGMSGTVFDPFFGTQSVTYTVTQGACVESLAQSISVVDPQVAVAGVNVSCFGLTDGSATATVTGGSGNYNYLWNPSGQTGGTATNLAAGTYTVTVTDVTAGCSSQGTITIVEPAEIVLTMTGLDACAPDLGSASVNATGGVGGFTYNWSPVASIAALVTGVDSTMATVVVTDGNGCTATDSVFVNIWDEPIVTIIPDTTISYGDQVTLFAGGGVSYVWTLGDDLDCSTCAITTGEPTENTIYCVDVTDVHGCQATECVLVTVEIICGDIFVPSAFSPNNDGENDALCVYSDCMKNMTFSIYNRWGEKVYETKSMSICWDGTWNGKELNSGVFVYVLDGYLINGQLIQQKGNISLIR